MRVWCWEEAEPNLEEGREGRRDGRPVSHAEPGPVGARDGGGDEPGGGGAEDEGQGAVGPRRQPVAGGAEREAAQRERGRGAHEPVGAEGRRGREQRREHDPRFGHLGHERGLDQDEKEGRDGRLPPAPKARLGHGRYADNGGWVRAGGDVRDELDNDERLKKEERPDAAERNGGREKT